MRDACDDCATDGLKKPISFCVELVSDLFIRAFVCFESSLILTQFLVVANALIRNSVYIQTNRDLRAIYGRQSTLMTRGDLKPLIRFRSSISSHLIAFTSTLLLIISAKINWRKNFFMRLQKSFKFILAVFPRSPHQQKVSSHSVCKARSDPFINASQMWLVRSLSSRRVASTTNVNVSFVFDIDSGFWRGKSIPEWRGRKFISPSTRRKNRSEFHAWRHTSESQNTWHLFRYYPFSNELIDTKEPSECDADTWACIAFHFHRNPLWEFIGSWTTLTRRMNTAQILLVDCSNKVALQLKANVRLTSTRCRIV